MSKRKFYLKYRNIPEWKNPSSVTSPSPLRHDWRPNQNYRLPFQLILFINPVLQLYSGHLFLPRYYVPSGTCETFFSFTKEGPWMSQSRNIDTSTWKIFCSIEMELSTQIHKRTPSRNATHRPVPTEKWAGSQISSYLSLNSVRVTNSDIKGLNIP